MRRKVAVEERESERNELVMEREREKKRGDERKQCTGREGGVC